DRAPSSFTLPAATGLVLLRRSGLKLVRPLHWRKPTGQPIANGAFWRILSATANARPGVRVVWVKVQDGDACGVLGYRLARAEAEKVRAGSEPVGGSGLILEDCADEDAAANLAWMREGEIQGDAA
ncbi:hypothetical protein, partial [Methylobacterium haplocladii]